MAKKDNFTVKLDCNTGDDKKQIKGKVFTKEHAERLLNLQERTGRSDWKLSEGQKIEHKDGNLIKS